MIRESITLYLSNRMARSGEWDNRDGQLGTNLNSYYLEPDSNQCRRGVVSAAGGYYHSATIVKADGSLWTIGKNNYGQLGDGTTTDRSTPFKSKHLECSRFLRVHIRPFIAKQMVRFGLLVTMVMDNLEMERLPIDPRQFRLKQAEL